MSIDFDNFLNWVESKFEDVVIKGDEILIDSIFCDDRKKHLWCNPNGGKTGCKNGVYHCWKSDKSGSLIGLVMLVEKCSFEEANDILGTSSEGSLVDLEKKVNEIFEEKKEENFQNETQENENNIQLPENCYFFDELPSFNKFRKSAFEYLSSRNISTDGLLVCTKGRYKNRIIIPYYDKNKKLIYYNGRLIGNNGLRYLGPPKELGVGKGDVVFAPKWPNKNDKIYITEGEFDALTLSQVGFNSVALGGKLLSEKQMEIIKEYKPVLCLDADEAGLKSTYEIASFFMSKGIFDVNYVRPSVQYKDWNGLLINKGQKILQAYIKTNEKKYSNLPGVGDWESVRLKMKTIS